MHHGDGARRGRTDGLWNADAEEIKVPDARKLENELLGDEVP